MAQKAEIYQLWNIVSTILKSDFTFSEIKDLTSLAGINRIVLSEIIQNQSKGSISKSDLLTDIDLILKKFTDNELKHFLIRLIEDLLEEKPSIEQRLSKYLNRVGWKLYNKQVLPVEIFDTSTLDELDKNSHKDLIKAVQRFRDGDLSGSIASASAAIDSLTYKIYQAKTLGDPDKVSFQEKCAKSIEAVGVYDKVESLSEIGWEEKDIKILQKNLKGALNQFATVMQKLRAKMSDAHGTKPVYRSLVFDSVQYAHILLRMLSENMDKVGEKNDEK